MQAKPSSPTLQNALYRLEKHGELLLGADGFYRVPGKYWSMDSKTIARLVALGRCRVDVVGGSTFAVALSGDTDQARNGA
jgi:hypothetical protein